MNGFNLPIKIIEDYISNREYGGRENVELRLREDTGEGGLKVTYAAPRDSKHPTVNDTVLSTEEIKELLDNSSD